MKYLLMCCLFCFLPDYDFDYSNQFQQKFPSKSDFLKESGYFNIYFNAVALLIKSLLPWMDDTYKCMFLTTLCWNTFKIFLIFSLSVGGESIHREFNRMGRDYGAISDSVKQLRCILKNHHLRVYPVSHSNDLKPAIVERGPYEKKVKRKEAQ